MLFPAGEKVVHAAAAGAARRPAPCGIGPFVIPVRPSEGGAMIGAEFNVWAAAVNGSPFPRSPSGPATGPRPLTPQIRPRASAGAASM